MKKINLFFVFVLAFTAMSVKVNAAGPTAPDITSYSQCQTYGESFKAIPETGTQDYYYKSCYRVACNNGKPNFANLVTNNGYRCNNGNGQPYVQVTSDKCSQYKNSCSGNKYNFCATVTYIDCKRTSSGQSYVTPTQSIPQPTQPTTQPTQATTPKPVVTTKRTTRVTTKKTTKTTTTVTTTTTSTTTAKKSNNTNLKKLVIDDTAVKFDNKKDNYTIKIPFDITELSIIAEPEDAKTTVTIEGNKDMSNEDTKVMITIVAEDGTTRKVTLTVKRYNGENDDCSLANIFIEDYPIEFDKDTTDYSIKLPKNVYSLNIEVVPTDEKNAKVEIKGNEKLNNKDNIEILVVSQSGNKCTYNIKIKKANNAWKYIVLIVILVAALIISSFILYKYLKKSKGKYKYE